MKNVLNKFEPQTKETNRFHLPLVLLITSFLAFNIVDEFFYLNQYPLTAKEEPIESTWKRLVEVLIILVIPTIGAILFVRKHHIGWVILMAIFTLLAFTTINTIFSFVANGHHFNTPMQAFPYIVLLMLSLSIFALLQVKNIRKLFQVTNNTWAATIISTLFVVAIIWLILP